MDVPRSTHTKSLYFDYPIYAFRRPPEMQGKRQRYPVAIGGGPVGLVLAFELGRRGIETIVLEAAETVSEGSRAACVSRRSMEILQQNGADERFLRKALCWVQQASQITEPDFAPLMDDMFFEQGSDIPVARFIAPRIEVELAFVLGKIAPFGEQLNAGDVVLSGSFTRPTGAAVGDRFDVDYGALGAVAFRFV